MFDQSVVDIAVKIANDEGLAGRKVRVEVVAPKNATQTYSYMTYETTARTYSEEFIRDTDEVDRIRNMNKCPSCNGEPDNGFDRCMPPNPYNCSKCEMVFKQAGL